MDWPKALGWLRSRTGQDLAPGQQEAVKLALTSKVAVLTGGPGCGKSFTVRSVVELATAKNATVVLVAPTGRAAKRLAELTGHEASTVHRLLELQPGGDPKYDRDHPLDADLVVIDECSMMDVILANKLIKAIPPGAHLLLVGDVDQLPSVGAGEVLRDLLAADSIPRVRLTQIFRQAQQSGIVVNAHRINHGQPPQLTGFRDFYWFACDPAEDSGRHPAEETAKLVVDIVARRIPAKFGLDPVRDVQVLTPMHRGPAGAGNLNALLQDALTPPRDGTPEKRYGGRVFRVGDKVTQLRNNYNKGKAGIFNGTVGDRHRPVPGGADPHRAHRRRRTGRLRLRRTRRTRPRLRRHHPPLPRQRIPRRGHPADHLLLDDAATQPALHRHHPRQDNSSSSPDPAAPSPKPSAPPEPAAATPHSPTDSNPSDRRADPNARQRAKALCDVPVNGLPAQTARSTRSPPGYRRKAGPHR